jgi:hypothetical protein
MDCNSCGILSCQTCKQIKQCCSCYMSNVNSCNKCSKAFCFECLYDGDGRSCDDFSKTLFKGVPVNAEKWSACWCFLHILLFINVLFSYSTLAQPSPVILFQLFWKFPAKNFLAKIENFRRVPKVSGALTKIWVSSWWALSNCSFPDHFDMMVLLDPQFWARLHKKGTQIDTRDNKRQSY